MRQSLNIKHWWFFLDLTRMSLVESFQNEDFPVFLISLKAGGTGLNLTAADAIIHYDPWWDPAVEEAILEFFD
ncbi:MAG: hypothetical protein GVY36_08330 [Verrucomicrobia bacterium]|jgi:SNF2 family DNA or RNA helicase|nr:hypothetical protein [Verrucomicrobiota bacterium]